MSDEKKSIWKRPWVIRTAIAVGVLLLTFVVFLIICSRAFAADRTMHFSEVFAPALILSVCASLASLAGIFLVRWLRHWRNVRRFAFGVACLATLIALFYAEENWRGKRAWEQCKRELEAKGEILDWATYIPAPIPDDQNVFKAPKMTEWFVRNRASTVPHELSTKLGYRLPSDSGRQNKSKSPVLIAEVKGVPLNAHAGSDERVVRADAADAGEKLGKIILDIVGPSAKAPQGFTFVLHQPTEIKPVRVSLQSDQPVGFTDVARLIPPNMVSSNVGTLRIEADAAVATYRIVLDAEPVISAADYLAATDAAAPEFDLIREALKRPQIRMDGDFQRPIEMPIANFVFMRTFAQTLAARAQCCLLLGRSEQALRELSLISQSRRLLGAKPTMLVSAMIDVAICGLHASTIADGFRLQAWREPDLAVIQQQIRAINLPPEVAASFREERAAVCHNLEVIGPGDLADRFIVTGGKPNLWQKLNSPVFLLVKFAPRGWIHQNLVHVVKLHPASLGSLAPDTQIIDPARAVRANEELRKKLAHHWWSPFKVLARIALPNFGRALSTAAQNQTLVNQALIVCGLERYRRANGEYPDTLDALVPRYVEKLPADVIGGQPLHYRRTSEGRFILYSVGWNATDDGGQPGVSKNGQLAYATGDWVWDASGK